ncbi:ABC transporter permease [Labrys monachus]|uniref:Ribose/xylose/arabinose/galactoside ABC-type transport system permease subunit n=1 Tax=Labrys monachus TaxID=217067 RepID=A0ABU0FIJ7_9HYPH|nr:ABC transporter permease [Labrys monachus]MDQ0394435.1 ribose/xylose/arabinose/galactoside ABC-type transport system permease subunit [Labrys monachus]
MVRNDDFLRAVILVLLVTVFGLLTNGTTYSALGLSNILLQSSIIGIAAIGQAFVVLTGAIDVSLYGIGVFASVLAASTMTSRFDLNIVGGDPWPVAAGVAIILLVGMAMGAANGLLVSRLRVPALIATLGTWQIGFGLAQVVGGGYTITNLPPALGIVGQGKIAGIPFPVIEMFLLFAIAHFVLRHTSFGRSVYAIGGNASSAYLSGIKVRRVQFLVFVISGLMVGLAALSIESRMMSVSIRTLSGLQLDSIAAVAVGGVSIYGGRGTILGVLLGTLILAVIDSGLGAMGASTDVQNTVKGVIIILAVSMEFFRSRGQLDQATP